MGFSTMTRCECLRALGLGESATAPEIRRAYRRLAIVLHPDRTGGEVEATDRFKAVAEAYQRLKRLGFLEPPYQDTASPIMPHEIRVPAPASRYVGPRPNRPRYAIILMLVVLVVVGVVVFPLLWRVAVLENGGQATADGFMGVSLSGVPREQRREALFQAAGCATGLGCAAALLALLLDDALARLRHRLS